MKKAFLVLLMIIVAFAFVSCNSEPEKKKNTIECVAIYDRGHQDLLTTIVGIPEDVFTWEDLARADVNHFDFRDDRTSTNFSHIAVVDGGVVVVADDGVSTIALDYDDYKLLKSSDSIQAKICLHLDV